MQVDATMGVKGGKVAGRASKACKGKKGRAFQACRRAYYQKMRK